MNKVFPKVPQMDQYRPIAVLSPVLKFLEGAIIQQLRWYGNTRLNSAQQGFQEGSGCDYLKFKVTRSIRERTEAPRPTFLVFFDFSSAYDRVNRRRLEELLREKRILPENTMQLWKFLAQHQRVFIGDCEGVSWSGVPQGSTISPMLFNVYAEPLISEIDNLGIRAEAFIYADDLAVLVDSITKIR